MKSRYKWISRVDDVLAIREKPALLRFGLAAVFVAGAFAVRFLLAPVVGTHLPFTFFITSTILAAWVGGYGPGLFALALGLLLGDWFFLPPSGVLNLKSGLDVFDLLANIIPALLAVVLIEALHRSRGMARSTANKLRTEVIAREEAQSQLFKAQEELQSYALGLEANVEARTREVRHSLAFLESFCYSIAHNLRGPLRAIEGFGNILQDELGSSLKPVEKMYLDRIQQAATRMDQLVKSLLNYGAIQHSQLFPVQVDVREVMETVLEDLKLEISSEISRLRFGFLPTTAHADKNLLVLIIKELIRNALFFSKNRPVDLVEVFGNEDKETVFLAVRDRGVGIDPKHQQRIFRLFETLGDSATHLGVGLALVSKGIEKMGGKIEVESQVGEGSTFSIFLPKGHSPERVSKQR